MPHACDMEAGRSRCAEDSDHGKAEAAVSRKAHQQGWHLETLIWGEFLPFPELR